MDPTCTSKWPTIEDHPPSTMHHPWLNIEAPPTKKYMYPRVSWKVETYQFMHTCTWYMSCTRVLFLHSCMLSSMSQCWSCRKSGHSCTFATLRAAWMWQCIVVIICPIGHHRIEPGVDSVDVQHLVASRPHTWHRARSTTRQPLTDVLSPTFMTTNMIAVCGAN